MLTMDSVIMAPSDPAPPVPSNPVTSASGSTVSAIVMAGAHPQSLLHTAKKTLIPMAPVSSFAPIDVPAGSTKAGGKQQHRPAAESPPEDISDSSNDDMPDNDTLPIVTGNVYQLDSIQQSILTMFMQDMCGPCVKAGHAACKGQRGEGGRLMLSCTVCSKRKKTCANPKPLWVRSIFDAMRGGRYSIEHPPLLS